MKWQTRNEREEVLSHDDGNRAVTWAHSKEAKQTASEVGGYVRPCQGGFQIMRERNDPAVSRK